MSIPISSPAPAHPSPCSCLIPVPVPSPTATTSPFPSPSPGPLHPLPQPCLLPVLGSGVQEPRQGAGRVQAECRQTAGPQLAPLAHRVHWLRDLSDSHLCKLLDAMEEVGAQEQPPPPPPQGPGGAGTSPHGPAAHGGVGGIMRGLGLGWWGWDWLRGGCLPPCLSPACPPCPPPQCTFAPGHVIIHEGDEGENFYIILKGEVGTTPRSTGEPPPMVRGRALPCVPHPIPPSPLSPFPCPGAAGAGEPAGGWAGEAAPCPGHRRALWGALPAAVGAPAAVPPPWQHLRCHPGLATWLRCHWLAWACCGQRAGPCGGGVVLAVAPHTPAQPRRPQHLQRRVGMAVVCSPASAHTHASLARAHMEL